MSANPAFTAPATFSTRPTLEGTFGMAASTHWLASASAQAVLERGGNAFDAAVAGAFVLHIVEPHLNGPGGDLTAIIATADEPDTPQVLMGQGVAPAGATIEHYRGLGLDLVPGAGALAAAIPAAVDAWLLLLEEYGTWELADVLEFAITYAEEGHPVLERVCGQIEAVKDLFIEHWPTSAELWMPGGEVPTPGQVITNPEYGAVLRGLIAAGEQVDPEDPAGRVARIAAARREWRTGKVARAIAEFVKIPHRHSDGGDYAGVMTAEDLAEPQAEFEAACVADFRGYTVAKTGPWGQGPALLQALRMLEPMPDEDLDPSTARGAHTILETLKLVLADRDARFGDEGTDIDSLLSEEYLAQRRALIGEQASSQFRPGEIGSQSYTPVLQTAAEFAAALEAKGGSLAGAGEPTVQVKASSAALDPSASNESAGAAGGPASPKPTPGDEAAGSDGAVRGDTCHIDVVDRWGNMISATPSGGWLQSSPAVPGIGFNLGTRLQMAWLDDASPSALRPGKRPRTTLTPTLVLKDGQPVLACGSPGGDQQDQWQLTFLLRVLVGGYTLQQAIDAPNLHTTSAPGSFWPRTWEPGGAVVEDRIGEDVIADLESRGHVITRAGEWALGRLSAVWRDPETGILKAGANPRGAQGYATGR